MDTYRENPAPTPSNADQAMFRDLRERNDRRRALRPPHSEGKRRIERVIEAARVHARLAKPFRSR